MRFRAALVALALALAACSGSLTPQEYFTQLEEIQQSSNEASQKALEDISTPPATPEEARDLYLSLLNQMTEIADEAIADIEALSPPSDLQDRHDAFVAALIELAEVYGSVRDQLEADGADAEQILQDADQAGTEANQAAMDACEGLQNFADDNDIDVDLECGREGEGVDKAAQSSLRNATAAAKTCFTDADTYEGCDETALAEIESALEWVGADEPSTAPNVVSMVVAPNPEGEQPVWAAAALSGSGTCFVIYDDPTVGTRFGASDGDCTATAALSAETSEVGW